MPAPSRGAGNFPITRDLRAITRRFGPGPGPGTARRAVVPSGTRRRFETIGGHSPDDK